MPTIAKKIARPKTTIRFILKSSNYLQVPVSQNYQVAVRDDRIATTDGSVSQCDPSFMIHYIQRLPEQFPVVNFYGLRRI